MKITPLQKDLIKIGIILLLVLPILIYKSIKNNESLNYIKVTNGVIMEIHGCFKSGSCFDFEYEVDGRTYLATASIFKRKLYKKGFIAKGKVYKVYYSIKDPGFCYIVIEGKKHSQISITGAQIIFGN